MIKRLDAIKIPASGRIAITDEIVDDAINL